MFTAITGCQDETFDLAAADYPTMKVVQKPDAHVVVCVLIDTSLNFPGTAAVFGEHNVLARSPRIIVRNSHCPTPVPVGKPEPADPLISQVRIQPGPMAPSICRFKDAGEPAFDPSSFVVDELNLVGVLAVGLIGLWQCLDFPPTS